MVSIDMWLRGGQMILMADSLTGFIPDMGHGWERAIKRFLASRAWNYSYGIGLQLYVLFTLGGFEGNSEIE